MKVTKSGIKCRQLHREGQSSRVPAEQGERTKAHESRRITENNLIDRNLGERNLLEEILAWDNIGKAIKRVRKNKGAAGIDGIEVHELEPYLEKNWGDLSRQILGGGYKPQAVRRVEIPKEERGKVRKLGIPTVVDRVIQQAIAQKLTPMYEEQFDDNSYGFRPKRSAHMALGKCRKNISEGYRYTVDLDLEKYFDTVNHSKLIQLLGETVKDGRVVSLIHKYLRSGVVVGHKFEETELGTPQGGPLSPLLSNIYLNELDRELRKRGHRFVRYADDLVIFTRSRKAAERALENILPFIERKLFLKVNKGKTVVGSVRETKFLGYSFYIRRGEGRLRIHPKSTAKMLRRIKELTGRSNGMGYELRRKKLNEYIRGWVNYFKKADVKTLLKETDKYLRRRIRMAYWKSWKRIRSRFKYLRKLGMDEAEAWEYANTRKGYWRIAGSPVLTRSLGTETLRKKGYIFFFDYYQKVTVN